MPETPLAEAVWQQMWATLRARVADGPHHAIVDKKTLLKVLDELGATHARVRTLTTALEHIRGIIGPDTPDAQLVGAADGMQAEIAQALHEIHRALDASGA